MMMNSLNATQPCFQITKANNEHTTATPQRQCFSEFLLTLKKYILSMYGLTEHANMFVCYFNTYFKNISVSSFQCN